jgi:predicted RNA-binding Zn ribbon-like protein
MSGHELGPRAGRLPLIGGALALDFCNTTSGLGSAGCLEHLNEYEHLLLWTVHARAITPTEADRLRERAVSEPAAARAALATALGLRRTLFDLFGALAHGRPAPADALAAGNAAPVDGAADGPLGPIARSAASVLLAEPLDRLKQCPGHECGWLFLDRSKNGIRVWCEMEVCGTRAKARARAERRRNG